MPVCTQCGEHNPDGVARCIKCGVALGGQMRKRSDVTRTRVASAANLTIRIVIAVVILALILPGYHLAGAAFYRYRLNSVKEAAIKNCGGPADTPGYQKDQVDRCVASNTLLIKAQSDYTGFTGEKQ